MAYPSSNFKIYTDGACINNGKHNAKCSIGVHFSNNNTFKIQDISKALKVPKHSNNIAELTAIQEALKSYDNTDLMIPLQIYSDSKYSMNCITQWYPNWKKKGIVETKKNHETVIRYHLLSGCYYILYVDNNLNIWCITTMKDYIFMRKYNSNDYGYSFDI